MDYPFRLFQTIVRNLQLRASYSYVYYIILPPFLAPMRRQKDLCPDLQLAIDKANLNTVTELKGCFVSVLIRYRSIPHSVTNQALSEMLIGRRNQICYILVTHKHPNQLCDKKCTMIFTLIKQKQFLVCE